jgi:phosphopantetheinyl transferase
MDPAALPPVRVCLLSLDSHASQPLVLTAAERERGARFLREEDRERYLLGRTLLRRLCASHLGCRPEDVPLRETERGKPYLESTAPAAERLELNLAHSGRCLALAWCLGAPVGVDVELLDRFHRTPFLELARTAFSPAERQVLAAAPTEEHQAIFFRIWVRKEAIVKAEGCGIAGALQRFSVVQESDGHADWADEVEYPGSPGKWRLVDLAAPARYTAAVALAPGRAVQVCTPDELAWAK